MAWMLDTIAAMLRQLMCQGPHHKGGVAALGDVMADVFETPSDARAARWTARGRRSPYVKGGRSFVHKVKVREDEHVMLVALANARDVTVSRLLLESALALADDRNVAVTKAEREAMQDELYTLRRQISGIATNLNQMAHHVNATGEFSAGIAPMAARAVASLDELSQVLEVLK